LNDGLETAGSKLRIAFFYTIHCSSEFSTSESSDAKGKFDSQAGSKDMHGDAILRPVWRTVRVDASFEKEKGITGIGLIG
jgi:hypothetical protein